MASTIQIRVDDDLKMRCFKGWNNPENLLKMEIIGMLKM